MRSIFAGIIDYAGLFPPASSSMEAAVIAYASYRTGPHRELLGRFVVTASRLEEMADAVASTDSAGGEGPWPLTVVMASNLPDEAAAVQRFRDQWPEQQFRIDSFEAKVASAGQVPIVLQQLPVVAEVFLELPVDGSIASAAEAVARNRRFAKVRTGGTSTDSFPTSEELTRFLMAVTRQRGPFKATAGLHHAYRGRYRLTYEPDAPTGMMFGFIPLLMATGFLLKDTPPQAMVAAIRQAAEGERALSPGVIGTVINAATAGPGDERRDQARSALEELSPRELEVAVEVGRGLSNAEIAAKLYQSLATVKATITRVLAKLGCTNRTQVAILVHDARYLDE